MSKFRPSRSVETYSLFSGQRGQRSTDPCQPSRVRVRATLPNLTHRPGKAMRALHVALVGALQGRFNAFLIRRKQVRQELPAPNASPSPERCQQPGTGGGSLSHRLSHPVLGSFRRLVTEVEHRLLHDQARRAASMRMCRPTPPELPPAHAMDSGASSPQCTCTTPRCQTPPLPLVDEAAECAAGQSQPEGLMSGHDHCLLLRQGHHLTQGITSHGPSVASHHREWGTPVDNVPAELAQSLPSLPPGR